MAFQKATLRHWLGHVQREQTALHIRKCFLRLRQETCILGLAQLFMITTYIPGTGMGLGASNVFSSLLLHLISSAALRGFRMEKLKLRE